MNEELLDIFSAVEGYHWWFEGRRRLLRRVMGSWIGKGYTILDIGCGTGKELEFLGKYGKVWGIDKSAKAVAYCQAHKLKRVVKADATKLPFGSESFDRVVLLDVLEHIKNAPMALKEAKRVLKRGGEMVITVPSCPALWSAHDELQNHYLRYDKKTLLQVGRKAGLATVRQEYFNFALFFPIAVIRLLSKLPAFKKLGAYDSKINFEIAKIPWVNAVLLGIFTTEIQLSKWVQYPVGVSLLSVMRPEENDRIRQ